MDSTLPALSSGRVRAMHDMQLPDMEDTWGPARVTVDCTVDLQVVDIRFIVPKPRTQDADP